MKIIIEHESFSATTTSLVVAERMLETIRLLQDAHPIKPAAVPKYKKTDPEPKKNDIFDTKDTSDIPPELIKPSLPPFRPAYLEKHIDFSRSKIVRYSNPCSTMHGECGGQCWQTELLVETGAKLEACDCEFYDLDELRGTLDAYIKITNMETTKEPRKAPCSMEKLNQIAVLFNQGCSNKQVAERLKLTLVSVSTYKSACKRFGLLENQ